MAMKVSASVFILLLSILSVGTLRVLNAQKTWCVAKPSASQATLLENIDFVCSKVDCSSLQQGGDCYTPNNLINHASIAMNSYYQSQGRNVWNCNFENSDSENSGLVTISDPSYGSCSYM